MPRVLDWIDPGNAGGSVRVPDAPKGGPILFRCRFCGLLFDTEFGRTNHVHETHPLLQPVLLLSGVPAPQQTVIRNRLVPADVAFEESSEILLAVDAGKECKVTAEAAVAALIRPARALVSLRLRNSQAESTYTVRITIPREEALNQVEGFFRTYLAHGDVTLADVDRFRAETARYEACEDYTSALGDYVVGVLIKDQAGGTALPFARYRDKLQAAASVLQDFSRRPLALAILQCIRFNLNDFGRLEPSGVPDLDEALRYYADKVTAAPRSFVRERSRKTRGAIALCPVDEATASLVATLSTHQSPIVAEVELIRSLEARAATALTSDPDKIKLYVAIADAWLARGDRSSALPYLARLEHDYSFGRWASRATEGGGR